MIRLAALFAFLALTLSAAKTPTLQLRTYTVIQEVQKMLEEGRTVPAKEKLDDYAPKVAKIPYDTAYLQTLYGYLYIATDRYDLALESYEKAYEPRILTGGMEQNVLYNLAQLYMSAEQYQKCADVLEAWFAVTDHAASGHFIMYANALIQMKKFKEAIPPVQTAIKKAKTPTESYYKTLFYLYYELDDLEKGVETVEKMIALFPAKKEYWVQLSGLYSRQEKEAKAMAVLEAAYRQNMLDESGLLRLARFHLYHETPYRAARIVEEGMKKEQVQPTEENLELLGQSWMQAREPAKAADAYLLAAKKSGNGKHYYALARLYADIHDYERVIEATGKALEKGVENEGETHFLQGVAYFEKEDLLKAKEAFRLARKDEKTRERAVQWIKYLGK